MQCYFCSCNCSVGCILWLYTVKFTTACVLCTFRPGQCFAPQRCELYWHVNLQKWSENGMLSVFWLGNVPRATAGCTLSSLIWRDGSAPAALASPLFDPPKPQIMGKTKYLATSYIFVHLHFLSSTCTCFFSDFFSSAGLLLFDSSHRCFSISWCCRKFEFKFRSISFSGKIFR